MVHASESEGRGGEGAWGECTAHLVRRLKETVNRYAHVNRGPCYRNVGPR